MRHTSDTQGWSLQRRPRLELALFVVIFLLGVVPKVATLLSRGAFWGDEAALAMNIGPRGFFELGRPFVYLQVAPWGSMAGMKLMTLIFGESELGYRAFPCLGATLALALAYGLGRRIHSPIAGLVAMFLTGTGYWLTHYSSELKPYAVDAAVAAALSLACVVALQQPERPRSWAVLAGLGVVGAWTSLPSLFVLGGCGLALGLDALQNRRGKRHIAKVAAVGVLWLVAFFVHYQTFIVRSRLATSKKVVKYWSDGFAPFPPTSLAELKWYPGKFFFFFESPGGMSLRYLAGAIFLFGLYALIKRGKLNFAIILFAPAVFAILASAVGKYPSVGRLMLFAVPAMMVMVAVGVCEFMLQPRLPLRLAGLALALVLVVPGFPQTYNPLLHPHERRDMRDIMAEIAQHRQPGDALFMAGGGLATIWDFYGPGLNLPKFYTGVDNLQYFDEDGNFPALKELADKTFGHQRLWLVSATLEFPVDEKKAGRSGEPQHTFITRYLERHGAKGTLRLSVDDLNLYLYDTTQAVLPEGVQGLQNPR